MDRFLSHFTYRLDAKGRLSIPASFRAVLARDDLGGLFVTPALDQPTLECGGRALLGEIDAMIEPFPPGSGEREAMTLALLGEGDLLKLDGEGRVVLTEPLKTHAAISDQATLVGVGTRFQIWEPERFRMRLAEAKRQAIAMRERTGPGTTGAARPSPALSGARE